MVSVRYKKTKLGAFSIYLDIYSNGKRKYEFLGLKVSKDYSKPEIDKDGFFVLDKKGSPKAKSILKEDKPIMEAVHNIKNKIEVEIAEGKYGFSKKDNLVIDFKKFLKDYQQLKNDDGIQRLLFNINEFDKNNLTFEDITFVWIQQFKTFLESRLRVNSIRNYLWKLKQVLNYAVDSGVIDKHNFGKTIAIPEKIEKDIDPLTEEEVKLLINSEVSFNPQIKQAFLFSCFTGLRQSDIINLQWSHIDLKTNRLRIIPQKTSNRKRNSKVVEGKVLNIQLTESALNLLHRMERVESSDKVFFNLPKRQIIGKHLQVWGLRVGLKKHLHFHLARHSFATIGMTAKIDVYDMQKLLLHSKIEQTQRYAKIVEARQKEEVKKFPNLF